MTKRKIETIAIQAGRDVDTQVGAVMPPIHLTTTFVRGNAGEFIYSRIGNPNRKALEDCLTDLEGGAGAIAFGSGMAAAVVDRTQIFAKATSLGGVESFIEHRAPAEDENTQTPMDLLRISVGLEHPDDLIGDLVQPLRAINQSTGQCCRSNCGNPLFVKVARTQFQRLMKNRRFDVG
jgi:cystathionine beta-lyase/cystathionine gamma-synthase